MLGWRPGSPWIVCASHSCASGKCNTTAGSVVGALGSIRISMGMGPAISGKGDGYLLIAGSKPALDQITPGRLQAMGDLWGGQLLYDSSGGLRQARSASCLADVLTNSTGSLIVSFYAGQVGSQDPVTGFYDTSTNTPFASCTIDQSATNHIEVTALYEGKQKRLYLFLVGLRSGLDAPSRQTM